MRAISSPSASRPSIAKLQSFHTSCIMVHTDDSRHMVTYQNTYGARVIVNAVSSGTRGGNNIRRLSLRLSVSYGDIMMSSSRLSSVSVAASGVLDGW